MRDDFCAFILTHGRPDKVLTYRTLRRAGYTGKIFIVVDDEDKTRHQYMAEFGEQVLVFSKADIASRFDEADNFCDRRSIFYARNACFDLAKLVGCKYFIQLDDDYHEFQFRVDRNYDQAYFPIRKLDAILSEMLAYYESIPALSIAMSQGGDFLGDNGGHASWVKRKAMNSFICSVDRPFSFMGRINEDVNTYTNLGRCGELFMTIGAVQLGQKQTQKNSGGMTELYLDSGRGLNYATARRYIKKTPKNAQTEMRKTAQKSAQKKSAQTAQKRNEKSQEKKPVFDAGLNEGDAEEFSFCPDEFGISDQQAKFAMLVAQGKKPTEAYRLAGYEGQGATANSNASRMLRNARVFRAISYFRNQYQKRYTADLDLLVSQLMAIVLADPNQLAQFRRVNCRYCWGENHLYQWRDIAEFDKAAAQASRDGKPEPEYGGLGFVDNAIPNPDCPKCCGEGTGQLYMADTTLLDGDARQLYAGAKFGKFGVEILLEDKAAARRELLRLLSAGGALCADKRLQELEIERRRMENQKLRKEIETVEDNEHPQPVAIKINVVDARVRSDEDDLSDA